jgi:hypothetical protein
MQLLSSRAALNVHVGPHLTAQSRDCFDFIFAFVVISINK